VITIIFFINSCLGLKLFLKAFLIIYSHLSLKTISWNQDIELFKDYFKINEKYFQMDLLEKNETKIL